METFASYDPGDFYDELIEPGGKPRPGAQLLVDKINSLPPGDLAMCQRAAEALLLKMGITFNVYGRDEGTEKIFPFDIIPRIVPDEGWVDLDPTNNLAPDEMHITLAWGRDYSDVAPVKGVVMGGGRHTLAVAVDVARMA